MPISEMEHDALTEVFNVGLSRAATQLSELLDDHIGIDVPDVRIVPLEQISSALGVKQSETVSGVVQQLDGYVQGAALLIFHTAEAQALIKVLIGAVPALDAEDMRRFEHEAISEIGNIIISSAISTISDLLRGEIGLSVPDYIENSIDQLITPYTTGTAPKQLRVVVMRAHLKAAQRRVSGSLVMLLGLDFIGKLLSSLGVETDGTL
jgi:chemotaxis protein CheC